MLTVSRLSKNPIIINLNTEEYVYIIEFLSIHAGSTVENNFIKFRYIKIPLIKIIFSHVDLYIPKEIKEKHITEQLKLDLITKLTFLRYCINDNF